VVGEGGVGSGYSDYGLGVGTAAMAWEWVQRLWLGSGYSGYGLPLNTHPNLASMV